MIYIYGGKIKDDFVNKYVGVVDEICCELNNMNLHGFPMKEEDYVVMMMCTYGRNEPEVE